MFAPEILHHVLLPDEVPALRVETRHDELRGGDVDPAVGPRRGRPRAVATAVVLGAVIAAPLVFHRAEGLHPDLGTRPGIPGDEHLLLGPFDLPQLEVEGPAVGDGEGAESKGAGDLPEDLWSRGRPLGGDPVRCRPVTLGTADEGPASGEEGTREESGEEHRGGEGGLHDAAQGWESATRVNRISRISATGPGPPRSVRLFVFPGGPFLSASTR